MCSLGQSCHKAFWRKPIALVVTEFKCLIHELSLQGQSVMEESQDPEAWGHGDMGKIKGPNEWEGFL